MSFTNYKIDSKEDLLKTGVYCLVNTINNKMYIGSTSMSFQKRFFHHLSLLRKNKHKNSYLQNAWNKYEEHSFEFRILEITEKDKTLEVEQCYLEKYSKNNCLYNINKEATGTPSLSREVIVKRSKTLKRRYDNGELIPPGTGKPAWNKGKTKKDIDYSFLKGIPKTISKSVINSRKHRKEKLRDSFCPEVYVYDENRNYLGKWRCSKDLEEWSLTSLNNLPVKSRFSFRMNIPTNSLLSSCINKSCKFKTKYKNLYFSNQPLHQVIDVEQQGELLGSQDTDNQQPSLASNSFEGSTTRETIQTDNAEDNDVSTSALPSEMR